MPSSSQKRGVGLSQVRCAFTNQNLVCVARAQAPSKEKSILTAPKWENNWQIKLTRVLVHVSLFEDNFLRIFQKCIARLLHFARLNVFIQDTGIQSEYLLTFFRNSHTSKSATEIQLQSSISSKVAYLK